MTKTPNKPPSTDDQSTAQASGKEPARGAKGRFVKRKPGAQSGNQSATVHGARKQRTKRGAIKNPDKFVRRGREAASRFWRDTNCAPRDFRRQTLAILESEILRSEDQMGPNYKPHSRDLAVKPLTDRYDRLVERRDALWAELRQTYCPTAPPAQEKRRFIAMFSTLDGEPARVVFPNGDDVERRVCEAEDRRTATEALEAAKLPTTDECIKSFWCGRLQPKQPEAPLNLPELDGLPSCDVAESDAEEPAPLVVPADDPVPAIEVDPPHVANPQPQPIPIAPYLGTHEHRSFDGGRGR